MSSAGLPATWSELPLGEVVEATGERVQPSDFPDLPFVGMDAVEAQTMRLLRTVPAGTMRSSAVRFRPGDVLYGRLRPYLNKVLAPDFEGLASAEFICMRPRAGVSAKFLQYRLNHLDFVHFASHLDEGDRPRVSFDQLAGFSICLPSREEQVRIAATIDDHFSRLDEAEAGLERVQRNLKRYRASVLQAAISGRLVPTEAELARAEGRTYEPASELLKRILAERRRKWEESGKRGKYQEPTPPDISNLPDLPEGWCWASWEQVSMRVTVGHVGKMVSEYRASGVPFLRSQNVRPNRFDAEGLRFIDRSFHERLGKSALRPGDLLVVRSGAVGTTCVVPDHLPEANCSDLVVVQGPLAIRGRFGAYYMNSLAKRSVQSQQVGIALAHFNTRSAAALPVPVPPLLEQDRVVEVTESLLARIDQCEETITQQLKRVGRLRQSILKWAFEGKLVDQDPGDEPAEVLLERIRAERAAASAEAVQPRRRGRPVGGRAGRQSH